MKIVHNIALSVRALEQVAFRDLGIELPLGFTSFKVDESDSKWPRVAELALTFQAVDTASTKFSTAELKGALCLGVAPSWHHGYPEPVEDRRYLQATFDLDEYCEVCGIGLKQIAPFRMKKAPAWGNKSILQLNWIFDEYFVTPEAWEMVFKPAGIGYKPVVMDKSDVVMDSVVQLDIPDLVNVRYDGESETCHCCGRKKFASISRGFYPSPVHTDFAAAKSSIYFGSGASAKRMVFVSSTLFKSIKAAGFKGIDFIPCRT